MTIDSGVSLEIRWCSLIFRSYVKLPEDIRKHPNAYEYDWDIQYNA